MALPKDYIVKGSNENHVLKLIKNVYGQKQAGRVWNAYLSKGLKEIGFFIVPITDAYYGRNPV
jgi:hypothetical protein